MRETLYETLKEACETAEKAGGDADKKLAEQNAKLQYRIKHLVRALEEKK